MTKRRVVVAAAAFAAVVAALAGVVYLMMPGSAICEASFARLEKGMSREQVYEVLKGPPRDETTGRITPLFSPPDANAIEGFLAFTVMFGTTPWRVPDLTWLSDEAVVTVQLDGHDCLTHKRLIRVRRIETAWEKVYEWLGL